MKNIYINLLVLSAFILGCDEKADYLEVKGPFASYYPQSTEIVLEPNEEVVTISIASSGKLRSESNAYVQIPADGSFVTSPAYDPFSKLLKVPISVASGTGSFTITYKNNFIQQSQSIYEIPIVDVDGDFNGMANNVFQLQVVEDDYFVDAPFTENFNESCLDDENGNNGLPLDWIAVSRTSDYVWRCSGPNRGFTGKDGDYAIEMSNFNSPDGNGADDWLITPQINFANSNKVMSYSSMLRYQGTTMSVLYSSDYVRGQDPVSATWVEIDAATAAFDNDINSFDFVNSGAIDLSGLPDKAFIAFRFISTGAGSGETGTARVDNFEIK